VNEAARLIRTSIVKVQSEEMSLDDLDEEVTGTTTALEEDGDNRQPVEEQPAPEQPEQPTQQEPAGKLRISRDQYQRTANMLVMHMQQKQDQSSSLTDLENWYLHEKEREGLLNTQQDLQHHTKLIKRILKRLVQQDHVLIETTPGQVIVHPNYDLDNENSLRRTAAE
jgi:hypothetical protein